ncbi:MAG: GIY-YIG nuclease family protein [Methanobacteriota archaeon]|nr:MAG: GIY-YIG nuclease family protein [Euryarchaeota archaeon]
MVVQKEYPETGSYILYFTIKKSVETPFGRLAGGFCYVGSARGPGGLWARIRRHLTGRGKRWWHIDYLTQSNRVVHHWVGVAESLPECEISKGLAELFQPVPGFGSSDCKVCRSHLYRVDDPEALLGLAQKLGMVVLDAETVRKTLIG